MALNVPLLRQNFALVVDREPQVVHRFYEILFERYPQLKPMFHRTPPERQEQMVGSALTAVMDHLEDEKWLAAELGQLGARHRDYGTTEEMYGWVGESLLATLAEVSGGDWSPELAAQWTEAFGAVRSMMLAGAQAAA